MTDKVLQQPPLTEATYYILLALVEPLHGYGVMQKVEQISQGAVRLGRGRSTAPSPRLRSKA